MSACLGPKQAEKRSAETTPKARYWRQGGGAGSSHRDRIIALILRGSVPRPGSAAPAPSAGAGSGSHDCAIDVHDEVDAAADAADSGEAAPAADANAAAEAAHAGGEGGGGREENGAYGAGAMDDAQV